LGLNKTSLKFKILDAFYIAMMIIPFVFGIVLNVLTKPISEGVSISGARIFFTIKMPLQDFPITESQVNSAIVMVVLFFFCLYITHGMTQRIKLKRQHLAELIVEKVDGLVRENMGEYFMSFAPFIISILALSALSS
jgi:F-type H+-transporting ATPase subunit a